MANFNLTITNEGAAFLADVIANQGTLDFTELRFSSTNYVGSETTLTAGTFGGTFITVAPSASILDLTTINLAASFDNTTFTVDTQLYSIGIIAEDGNNTEYLVAVCTTSAPDTIPAYMAPASYYSFNINMAVSSTNNITVTGSVAGVLYVSDIVDDLNSYENNKPLSANQGRVLKGMIQAGGLLPHIIITTDTGATVTLTKGGTTITATETSTGVYEADVDDYGTWTIKVIKAGIVEATVALSVDIVKIYNETINIIPDGSTVTPTDDIQTWLHCADIWDKTYTTLTEVLSDATTLSALISDNNAVDYMVRSITWTSDVCADSTAMSYIGLANYCSDALLGDNTWLAAIVASSYMESILNVKVPTMTSNTTPSGTAFSDSAIADHEAYRAFDGSGTSSSCIPSTDTSATDFYCGYDWGRESNIYYAIITADNQTAAAIVQGVTLESYSNNGWHTEYTYSEPINWLNKRIILNGSAASKMRWRGTRALRSGYGTYYAMAFFTIQFYGREDV